MKRYMMMLTAVALISGMAWAQDGAALYKSKCAMCHGAVGEGKIGPSLQKTTGKKAPHGKAVSGFTSDQAAQVATYVGTLKK
jgi:cytochrome c